ncbi:MAG: hypothetical protein CM15mP55_1080 [Hyphomicrobiales bacterium]|nr:MAG: hypothetical protein CM15mP55_1080 [Hyphomicrobiales bacterium]
MPAKFKTPKTFGGPFAARDCDLGVCRAWSILPQVILGAPRLGCGNLCPLAPGAGARPFQRGIRAGDTKPARYPGNGGGWIRPPVFKPETPPPRDTGKPLRGCHLGAGFTGNGPQVITPGRSR